jgi:hypothetical protein
MSIFKIINSNNDLKLKSHGLHGEWTDEGWKNEEKYAYILVSPQERMLLIMYLDTKLILSMGIKNLKIVLAAGQQWLTPGILVTWEAEMGRIMAGGQPGQNVHKTPSQSTAGHSSSPVSSQATQEAEIGRTVVLGQLGQKGLQDTISMGKKKMHVVSRAIIPDTVGSII